MGHSMIEAALYEADSMGNANNHKLDDINTVIGAI